jgi:hypothetical protein
MTKNELKQLWFTLPTSKVLKKCIIVEPNYGHVEIMSDGPNGYKSFKKYSDDPVQYALNTKEYQSGEYELIIK